MRLPLQNVEDEADREPALSALWVTPQYTTPARPEKYREILEQPKTSRYGVPEGIEPYGHSELSRQEQNSSRTAQKFWFREKNGKSAQPSRLVFSKAPELPAFLPGKMSIVHAAMVRNTVDSLDSVRSLL
jgi:hypothetical protein